ncbi:hypothetical protein PDG61_10095 [Mycolicibacterium sp. BiH015]|uniref:hypothetical protein n=1 Tax=Mycolicibacterium sp. BiH015 TaxID=3018808 RepID=UPI0022E254DB|nr:hypothetical protein [Mycolicibacterium sp. BiH015]MDA2891259.1 hypothetical protein [Mycolicibacterium sp. BiH015]
MSAVDNTATTWRDLADQLTPAQIEHAEHWEEVYRERPASGVDAQQRLLEEAREHARKNLNDQVAFGHLPAPAGARRLWHWEPVDESRWEREFEGTCHEFAEFLRVQIRGVQHSDGRIDRYAGADCDTGDNLSPADLRGMAALLAEAADEIERLNRTAVENAPTTS